MKTHQAHHRIRHKIHTAACGPEARFAPGPKARRMCYPWCHVGGKVPGASVKPCAATLANVQGTFEPNARKKVAFGVEDMRT